MTYEKVKSTCMNIMWQKLWPNCMKNILGFEVVAATNKDILNSTHEVGSPVKEMDDTEKLLTLMSKSLISKNYKRYLKVQVWSMTEEISQCSPL
ncbi:hypothetical protein PR048_012970 [Dryococelus australis]|uniref:Uncharacterized protein n=1 Tax=Dryococelus australis TaxID=614101 RepID=A0ABQ9HQV6_9NEOP|nr:hypothetical protein PR048_012970 [Dryococelus australis]